MAGCPARARKQSPFSIWAGMESQGAPCAGLRATIHHEHQELQSARFTFVAAERMAFRSEDPGDLADRRGIAAPLVSRIIMDAIHQCGTTKPRRSSMCFTKVSAGCWVHWKSQRPDRRFFSGCRNALRFTRVMAPTRSGWFPFSQAAPAWSYSRASHGANFPRFLPRAARYWWRARTDCCGTRQRRGIIPQTF